MMVSLKWLLGLGIILVVYVYALYPMLLWLLGRIFPRGVQRDERLRPSVAIVFCAYNEEAVIEEKLRNCLTLDYPADRLQILVASDHSSDGTDAIIQSIKDDRILFYRSPQRMGKTTLLNQVVPLSGAEVLVFCDANTFYDSDSIKKLVRNFADPSIGFVTGRSRYSDEGKSPAAASESLYWRYEDFLKRAETRIGSMVGADGAIYAIRRGLYWPLYGGDASDFVNPIQIVLAGWRGIYDPEAVCWELTSGYFAGEFRRKVRIATACLRSLMRIPSALNPLQTGWFALELISHKLLRWLIPFFLLLILVASALLAWYEGHPIYIGLFVVQLAFYVLAVVGWAQRSSSSSPRVFYFPYYFCLVNLAALIGVLNSFRGREAATWEPQRGGA